MEYRELQRERLVVALPSEHPLPHRDCLALKDIFEETFVDFPSHTPGRLQSNDAFHSAGLERHVSFEAMDTKLMLQLVEAELGVCVMPEDVLGEPTSAIPVQLPDGPTRTEYLMWSSDNLSPVTKAFLKLVSRAQDEQA